MASVLSVEDSSSKKHRTSVLYDFSIVKKAKFYEFTSSSTGVGDKKTYVFNKHIYTIQINPREISASMGVPRLRDDPALADNTQRHRSADYPNRENSLNIELRYDIFDEYMVRTGDGLLQGAFSDFDLTSKDATSLRALMDGYNDPNLAYLFKWGPIEYFGHIESLDFSYTAFSRWGHPLKGLGNLRLSQEGETIDSSGKTIDWVDDKGTGQTLIAKEAIESLEKVEDLTLRAAIGTTQALR